MLNKRFKKRNHFFIGIKERCTNANITFDVSDLIISYVFQLSSVTFFSRLMFVPNLIKDSPFFFPEKDDPFSD